MPIKNDSKSQNGIPERLDSEARRGAIEAAGLLFQGLGFPRSAGQIYGLLFMYDRPLSLDQMTELLFISKGSASMSTRQLASLGAVRQVWVEGERRDYFEAVTDLGDIARSAYDHLLRSHLSTSERRVDQLFNRLEGDAQNGAVNPEEYEFLSQRLSVLRDFFGQCRKVRHAADQIFSANEPPDAG